MDTIKTMQEQCGQLKLLLTRDQLVDILRQAQKASWTHAELLEYILKAEVDDLEDRRLRRRLTWAQFPYTKSLADFKLGELTGISDRQLKELSEFHWVHDAYNLILLGPPGVGKTHLALGLGLAGIKQGLKVYYTTMNGLLDALKTEEFMRKSQIMVSRVRKADVVIIDDLMYFGISAREQTMFFHLIHDLYENTAIILTSNRSPELWSTLADDPATTTAIFDRLLHRSEIIKMDGDSFRMKHQETIFNDESVKT